MCFIYGRIYEFLICEALAYSGVTPFYYQAKFPLIPSIEFDIVLYEPKRPVVLSLKTTLRERYKQAALEGVVLKQVYRHAKCHLLSFSDEAHNIQTKIGEGDVDGLTSCVQTNTTDFDELVGRLKGVGFVEAEPFRPLSGKTISGAAVP